MTGHRATGKSESFLAGHIGFALYVDLSTASVVVRACHPAKSGLAREVLIAIGTFV